VLRDYELGPISEGVEGEGGDMEGDVFQDVDVYCDELDKFLNIDYPTLLAAVIAASKETSMDTKDMKSLHDVSIKNDDVMDINVPVKTKKKPGITLQDFMNKSMHVLDGIKKTTQNIKKDLTKKKEKKNNSDPSLTKIKTDTKMKKKTTKKILKNVEGQKKTRTKKKQKKMVVMKKILKRMLILS